MKILKNLAFIFAFVLLAACSHTTSPVEAVVTAAASAPEGVPGTFKLHVLTVGEENGTTYLNSEEDYRDQRNLSIAISAAAADALTRKFGVPPDQYFKDKTITVSGEAKRVTIWFTADGRRTQKYYYQTHVEVIDAAQIEVL